MNRLSFCFVFPMLAAGMVQPLHTAGQNRKTVVPNEDLYDISVSGNGMLVPRIQRGDRTRQSADGTYWCRFSVAGAGDEVRDLTGFRFFHGDTMVFGMEDIPGSEIIISDRGWIAFLDYRKHFQDRVEVFFYGPDGDFLFSRLFHETRGMAFSAGASQVTVD